MIIKSVTVPQNLAVSNFFDTEGLPIFGVRKNVATLDGTTEFALQTLAPGQDASNPSAVWIPVIEGGVGARITDAGGAAAAEDSRPAHHIPTGVFDVAGSDAVLFMFNNPQTPIKSFAATDVTATSVGEAEGQALSNAFAYALNKQKTPRLPNILRINLTNNQTTAAVPFDIYLAEPQRFVNLDAPRFVDVVIPNADADSNFFALAPGEKIVGLAIPAAFTTTNLNLQTVKNGLDPAVITDANWLNLVHATSMRGATAAQHIWQHIGAAQGSYIVVPELPYLELPRFLRLHGSGAQGAARTVRVFIQ